MSQATKVPSRNLLRGVLFALSLGLVLPIFLSVRTSAQGQERKPVNLKVLDSNITHDELIGLMNKFTVALGVGCDHCHAPRSGSGGRDMDFPSDANKTKETARAMLQMVSKINGTMLANLPTEVKPPVAVECMTCHRGQAVPRLLPDVLKQVRKDRGMVAVDSVYRDLRKEYYGSGTFDFSDLVLARLGLELSQENGNDALKLLKLNKEFNAQSTINEWAMGKVYAQLGDTTSAISQYKHALEIDPNNRRATRDLQMIQGGGKDQH